MLGVFAEFKTNLRRQCQADGIATIATKENKGIYKRQPNFISQDSKTNILENKLTTRIAKDLEISRGTVYKVKQLISRTPNLE